MSEEALSNVIPMKPRRGHLSSQYWQICLTHMRPDAAYIIKTMRGSTYRVRLDSKAEANKADSGRVHLLVSMTPSTDEVSQHAAATITVGKPWELSPGHSTSEVTSIKFASSGA